MVIKPVIQQFLPPEQCTFFPFHQHLGAYFFFPPLICWFFMMFAQQELTKNDNGQWSHYFCFFFLWKVFGKHNTLVRNFFLKQHHHNEFWEGEISNTITTKFTVFRLNFAFFSEPLQWRVFPGGEAKIWFFCQFRNSNFFSRKICLIEFLKSFPPPHRLFSCASQNLKIIVKFIFWNLPPHHRLFSLWEPKSEIYLDRKIRF